MTTPWSQIVQTLDPDYQDLLRILEEGPDIKLILNKSTDDETYSIILQEFWFSDWSQSLGSERLDERLIWTSETLSQWTDVDRIEWNSWRFLNLRDAERFIILYNLKWS